MLAGWLAASLVVTGLAGVKPQNPVLRRALDLAIPVLFGGFVFYLWEVAVRGFGVPAVLMPSPSATAARFSGSLATLAEDFVQTFVRGMLTGYVIGCGAGFLVAIIAYRFTFLGRGLLPIGNFISALPIVGIAPDHGDVVRLRLALQGRGGRHHHVLPDAGEHARRPRRRPGTSNAT